MSCRVSAFPTETCSALRLLLLARLFGVIMIGISILVLPIKAIDLTAIIMVVARIFIFTIIAAIGAIIVASAAMAIIVAAIIVT